MAKQNPILTNYRQKASAPTAIGKALDVGDDLPIASVRTDGGTQARAGLHDETLEIYTQAMRDGAAFPPIVVYHDGANHWLADGFHRVEAARRAGRATIRAQVEQGDQRAAILHAVGVNETHGLRRTRDDAQRAVMRLLNDAEWGQWSDREIARRCAVSPSTVGSAREKLSVQSGQIVPAQRTVERGGTTYQQKLKQPAAPQPALDPDSDYQHKLAVERIVAKLDQWADSERPAQIQDAYARARQIRDRTLYNRAFAIIDRAVEGTEEEAPKPKSPELAPAQLPALPPRPGQPPHRPRQPRSADVSARMAYAALAETYMDQAAADLHDAHAYIAALESLVMALQKRNA